MNEWQSQISQNIPDLQKYLDMGVKIENPICIYIEAGVEIGVGSVILSGSRLSSQTVIGKNCVIGPEARISNCQIGDEVHIFDSTLVDSKVGSYTKIGPYSYVRPNTVIGEHVKIGDFVELKNSKIGDNTKISHLTYVGDSDLGKDINIGCGVVFVNYDGINKHRSVVEDGAFIGCNVNLVSPVKVGKGAYVAAGSTITRDVKPDALEIARERKQTTIDGWAKKHKLSKKK